MCKVCTEAVHCVALWTRTLWQVWAFVRYMYQSSPLRSTLNTNVITGLGMCKVCTGATHNPPRTESVLTVYQTDINTWFTLGRTVETAHNPPRTKTVLTVCKMDINTLFTLGSTCEKMRADRGSEGTTTKCCPALWRSSWYCCLQVVSTSDSTTTNTNAANILTGT